MNRLDLMSAKIFENTGTMLSVIELYKYCFRTKECADVKILLFKYMYIEDIYIYVYSYRNTLYNIYICKYLQH